MINTLLKNPLYKFCLWCLGILLVCFIGISNVCALTFTTKTIYGTETNGSLSNQGYYQSGYINQGGVQSFDLKPVGSTISGVSYGFKFFYFDESFTNRTYTLRINFMSNDLKPDVNASMFYLNSCTGSSCNPVTLVSINRSSTSANSTWIEIKYNPVSVGSYVSLLISGQNNEALTSVSNYGISSVQLAVENPSQDIIDNQTNNTNNIINNNNSNTQDIINNNNSNTQDIINNQNSIAQQQEELQMVCTENQYNDTENIYTDNHWIDNTGTTHTSNDFALSDYILIENGVNQIIGATRGGPSYCLYNLDKTLTSCESYNYRNNITISITNRVYIRYTIEKNNSNFSVKLNQCKNGNQALQDSLTNDNVDSSSWANFFNNFTTNTFGLTSIVTAPLNLIQSITNTTCTDLQLPLPYLQNKYLTLPCMSSIYSQYFGTFFTLYQTITYGIIAYWVCVRIFNLVKDFKNPDHDEIEVVDL